MVTGIPTATIGILKKQRGPHIRQKKDLAGVGGAAMAATNAAIEAGGEKVRASFRVVPNFSEKRAATTPSAIR